MVIHSTWKYYYGAGMVSTSIYNAMRQDVSPFGYIVSIAVFTLVDAVLTLKARTVMLTIPPEVGVGVG